MFKGAKVVRLVPDQPGRGGTKTAQSTQSKVLDTFITDNCTVFLGRWSTASAPILNNLYASPSTMGYNSTPNAVSQALYNFAAIDTTNATLAPTNHLMEHLYDVGVGGKENIILDHSVFGSTGRVAYSALSAFSNFCVPATFLSIQNRCFICWGGKNTTVGVPNITGTPMIVNNIIYDPTSAGQKYYDIGVHQPQTAATYNLAGTATGTTSATNGSNKVNNATVSGNWSGSTLGITIAGVPYQVTSPGGYITSLSTSGTFSGTSGNNFGTVNGFLFPVNGDWNGLTLTVGGHAYVISSYAPSGPNTTVTFTTNLLTSPVTAAYTVTGEQLVLTTSYTGGTNLLAAYTAGTGALSWTGIGPQYAYAYYDPITGHISNVSPITQVIEQNMTGVNVNLSNIAYSQNNDSNRFTKIVIFRTLASQGGISGGVLYPIGDGSGNILTIANGLNSFGGTTVYLDTNPDSNLLLNAGLQAPLTTNRAPVGPFAHMMFWDGRIWGNPVSDPTAIYFSCDTVQCPFGVPTESFPSANILRIPAEDGRVTGMKLVGAYGVVTTNRYSYYPSGSNELNYRLLKFASTTFGVGDYQMVEFAGDTTDNSAALVYLGGDGIVYMLSPSYGNVSMSEPIQDQLYQILGNNQVLFSAVRIAKIASGAQKFLLVSTPLNPNIGPQRRIFLYDFNRKIWTMHDPGQGQLSTGFGYPFSSFATVYQAPYAGTLIPADFVMSSQGNIYSWLRPPAQSPGVDPAFIETFPFDFGRKSKKQINEVRIYCNAAVYQNDTDVTKHWTVQVVANENFIPFAGPTYIPVVNQDPEYQLQGGNSVAGSVFGSPFPLDGVDARELVVNFPTDANNAIIANRFEVKINFPTANVPQNTLSGTNSYQLYAVDVVYTDLNDPDYESL